MYLLVRRENSIMILSEVTTQETIYQKKSQIVWTINFQDQEITEYVHLKVSRIFLRVQLVTWCKALTSSHTGWICHTQKYKRLSVYIKTAVEVWPDTENGNTTAW
jgi:hypothetical protein